MYREKPKHRLINRPLASWRVAAGESCGCYLNGVPACPRDPEQMDPPLFINKPGDEQLGLRLEGAIVHFYPSYLLLVILHTHPAWARISTTQEVYVLLTPILRVSVYISSLGG